MFGFQFCIATIILSLTRGYTGTKLETMASNEMKALGCCMLSKDAQQVVNVWQVLASEIFGIFLRES